MNIACVIGTRPEAIKIAPVVHAARRSEPSVRVRVVNSGQHGPEVAALLGELKVAVNETFDDCVGLRLTEMTARLIKCLGDSNVIREADIVLVQGDTTTAMAAALAGFQQRVPVAHLEAGLRSRCDDAPFPEEANRKLIAMLARVHLAPTQRARRNLLDAGIDDASIAVTGNTSVDALLQRQPAATLRHSALVLPGTRLILATLHRRESWGAVLEGLCDAIGEVVRDRDDTTVLLPVHPNPAVRETVTARLAGVPHVVLTDPLTHHEFAGYLHAAHLVITDSGGVQEEAVTLGKATLVLRATSDRPEGIDAGVARLVGTDPMMVRAALRDALETGSSNRPCDVYGDGRAAERVVLALERWHRGLSPLLPADEEFRSSYDPPAIAVADLPPA